MRTLAVVMAAAFACFASGQLKIEIPNPDISLVQEGTGIITGTVTNNTTRTFRLDSSTVARIEGPSWPSVVRRVAQDPPDSTFLWDYLWANPPSSFLAPGQVFTGNILKVISLPGFAPAFYRERLYLTFKDILNPSFEVTLSNLVSYDIVENPNSRIIGGRVRFADLVYYGAVPSSVTLDLKQGEVLVTSIPVQLDSQGRFSTNLIISPGQYSISCKHSHWLRKAVAVDLSYNQLSIDLLLKNGDIDGDNEVGIGDYAILSTAYNSDPGSGNWNPQADLNGDEEVSIADYAILSTNYGEVGD